MIQLFAQDTVTVATPCAKIIKSGYIVSEKPLYANEAYRLFTDGKFLPIPTASQFLGYDPREYWYAFEIEQNSGAQTCALNVKNNITQYCDLFEFDNGHIISRQINGYSVALQDRRIKSIPILFELNTSSSVYMVKLSSHYFKYTSFEFAPLNDIKDDWQKFYYVILIVTGIYFALALYYLFVFISLKESLYLYYVLYISGLFSIMLALQGYAVLTTPFVIENLPIILTIARLVVAFSIVAFSLKFLSIGRKDKILRTVIVVLASINIINIALSSTNITLFQVVLPMLSLALFMALLFAAFKRHIEGDATAKYYLIANGVPIIFLIVIILTLYGYGLSYSFFTVNLVPIGVKFHHVIPFPLKE